MKNSKLVFWALALLALVLLVFARTIPAGSLVGSVSPHGSATQVWLFSGSDTLRGAVQNDAFEIANAKAGTYNLIVEPSPTYKPTLRSGIVIRDGESTNTGQIIMEQKK
jgi:hypothetical protein